MNRRLCSGLDRMSAGSHERRANDRPDRTRGSWGISFLLDRALCALRISVEPGLYGCRRRLDHEELLLDRVVKISRKARALFLPFGINAFVNAIKGSAHMGSPQVSAAQ